MDSLEKKQALRKELESMGTEGFDMSYVTETTLSRYLHARKGDVHQAAKMLHHSLKWRQTTSIGTLKTQEFESELQTGKMYVMGPDSHGNAILVTRKKSDGFKAGPGQYEHYMRHLAFTLETCTRCMAAGQHQWVWILDMAGYSRANSPPLNVSLATLRVLADCYPERLKMCFFVDAPSIFSFLWSALSAFIDPVTKAKVQFVKSTDIPAQIRNAYIDQPTSHLWVPHPSLSVSVAGSSIGDGDRDVKSSETSEDQGTSDASVSLTAQCEQKAEVRFDVSRIKQPAVGAFVPYVPYYVAPYDKDAFVSLLKRAGWE